MAPSPRRSAQMQPEEIEQHRSAQKQPEEIEQHRSAQTQAEAVEQHRIELGATTPHRSVLHEVPHHKHQQIAHRKMRHNQYLDVHRSTFEVRRVVDDKCRQRWTLLVHERSHWRTLSTRQAASMVLSARHIPLLLKTVDESQQQCKERQPTSRQGRQLKRQRSAPNRAPALESKGYGHHH